MALNMLRAEPTKVSIVGKQKRCLMNASMLESVLIAGLSKEKVTTDTVIDAFEYFFNARQNNKPCFIILDNASFHRSTKFKQKIQEWLMNDVLVCYLPPYSPELNIIEILWKKVKHEWLPCEAFKRFNTSVLTSKIY